MYGASNITAIGRVVTPINRRPPFRIASQPASRLETLAQGAAAISAYRQGMLGALLGTTVPSTSRGLAALRPLWVNEAMQRACDFVTLFGWVERDRSRNPSALEAEWHLVRELASLYASLNNDDDATSYPCSQAIRIAARDHVELFGSGSEPMKVFTAVDRLTLPAYRQRALVLVTCRLVIEALHRVAARHGPSRLVVLLAVKSGCAALAVTQELSGPYRVPDIRSSECTQDLAALLQCDPQVEAQRHFITTTLRFPVAG
jgi:hypothetical protein